VLDHDRNPKLGYHALREACAPVIVVAERPAETYSSGDVLELDVHVISDRRSTIASVRTTATVTFASGFTHRQAWDGEVPADGCVRVGTIALTVPKVAGPVTIELTASGVRRPSSRSGHFECEDGTVTDAAIAPATQSKTGPLVLRTSIGKKYAMAASGVILVGFVISHMVGNLKFFTGEHHFDEYASFIRRIGDPIIPHYYLLWGLRAVLLGAVTIHIWAAYQTTVQSKKARPIGYAHTDTIQASYASRTMRWGGIILLLFIVFHILDLTVGATHVGSFTETTAEHGHAYANAVSGFQHPIVTIAYTLAMGALCLHLFHGIWSMFQTFGRNNAKISARLKTASAAISVLVCIGFLSMPYAVMFGVRP